MPELHSCFRFRIQARASARPVLRLARRAGFTLVEMSVVLVIVALIVGGILMGEEMVHASEINSIVGDFNRYKTAVATFRLKYDAWPGDMPTAVNYWGITANGNGDGNINAGTTGFWTDNSEMYRVWQQLGLSNMVPGSYTGISASSTDTASTVVPGSNVPTSKIGGFYMILKGADALHDANIIAMWGGNPYLSALTPEDTRSVDAKMDDGRPGTGLVSVNLATSCATGGSVPQTANYNLLSKDTVCCPIYWLN